MQQDSIIEVLRSLFKRDLTKLRKEIEAYQNEDNLWLVEENITNSAGNLCLHLAGNIKYFIGTELGHTGYVRKRIEEFSLKNVARIDLLKQVEETIVDVDQTLVQLTNEQLKKEYRIQVFGSPMTTEYFLVHLAMHLDYHLGQINYHRRLLDK